MRFRCMRLQLYLCSVALLTFDDWAASQTVCRPHSNMARDNARQPCCPSELTGDANSLVVWSIPASEGVRGIFISSQLQAADTFHVKPFHQDRPSSLGTRCVPQAACPDAVFRLTQRHACAFSKESLSATTEEPCPASTWVPASAS